MPSTLTRPLMPEVRSSTPVNDTVPVSSRSTLTSCDVDANS